MGRFFDRYRQGEYKQVWDELLAQGEAVRREPLLTDASAVARETMQRVRHNIEVLIPRLRAFGYEFGDFWGDEPLFNWVQEEQDSLAEGNREIFLPFYLPHSDVSSYVDQLEQLVGPLPLSLRAFYLEVGGVNFLGTHPAWPGDLNQEMLDPLWIRPLTKGVLEDCLIEHVAGTPFELNLAPDIYHKYNSSGGGPYRLILPDARIDSPFLHEAHHTTFVNYLRICFRSAGLPPLEVVQEKKDIAEALAYLRQGLLPI